MNKTDISYLDYTWNPITMRCTPVSEGCENCWHLAMCKRLENNSIISPEKQFIYGGIAPPEIYDRSIHKLKTPSIIGVQFMGDLFHASIPYMDILDVYDMMDEAPQHKYMVLTKREWRLVEQRHDINHLQHWSHIYHGITTENQKRLDERLFPFLRLNGKKWISFEPLLGPIGKTENLKHLDYVVIGCESGPKRRHMELSWAIDIVQQCDKAGVPVHVKQVEIEGKVSHNPEEWPEVLRRRDMI